MAPNHDQAHKPAMSPIAWVFIAIFSGLLLIICLVYLYGMKVRRDIKRAEKRKAEHDVTFGGVIKNAALPRKSFDNHQQA